MLLRAALIAALMIGAPVVIGVPSVAHADGIERPKVQRPAPRPRARPARPAPRRVEAPPPAPQIIERIIVREPEMRLTDGFFYGPLTGGVGFGLDAGSGLGGGATIINGGASKVAVSVSVSQSVRVGGGTRGGGCCH